MLRLILLFDLCQLITSVKIVSFTSLLFGQIPTITNDTISLSIELDDCSTPCACHVRTNRSGAYHPAKFIPASSKRGIVSVNHLQPYTLYSFDANCSNVPSVETYMTRTDVGRPSSPRNVAVELKNKKLQLTWLAPHPPLGPISLYRIIVDGKQIEPAVSGDQTSYQMKTDYVQGTKHTIAVTACNIDTQNRTLCSDPKATEVIFDGQVNTVTAVPKPPTLPSISNHLKAWRSSLVLGLFILFMK